MPTPRSRHSPWRHTARARAWLLFACLALCAGAALAWAAGGPPSDADVVGAYRFTYTVTNARGATKWIYKVRRRCGAPCVRFSVIPRLLPHTKPASRPSVYTWMHGAYERRRTMLGRTDCVGRDRATVASGYDIVSRERVRVTRRTAGRVLAFEGRGVDDYRPNARGRRGGCRRGAYIFRVVGVALPGPRFNGAQ